MLKLHALAACLMFLATAGCTAPGQGTEVPGSDRPTSTEGVANLGGSLSREAIDLAVRTGAGQSAVWTGSAAYIFGGFEETKYVSDKVIEYIPGESSRVLLDRIPEPELRRPKAIWTGQTALMAGGWVPPNGRIADILSFDPATGVTEVVARLPEAVDVDAVIWHAGTMYTVGGDVRGGTSDRIHAYKPGDAEAKMVGRLATGPIKWGGYAELGGLLYLLGGHDGNKALDRIVEFNPETLEARVMNARLPNAATDVIVASDGAFIYIIGGRADGKSWRSSVDIFDPRLDLIMHTCAQLKTPLSNAVAFATGPGEILLLGGVHEGVVGTSEVQRFRWAAPSPADVQRLLEDIGTDASVDCLPQPIQVQDVLDGLVQVPVKDVLPANVVDTIPLGEVGGLAVHSGGIATTIQAVIQAATDPALLKQVVPALPGQDPEARPVYLQVDAEADGEHVRVELSYEVVMAEIPVALQGEAVATLYYYDGSTWIDLSTSTDRTLVNAAGVDAVNGVAWADVDRLGTFAVGSPLA